MGMCVRMCVYVSVCVSACVCVCARARACLSTSAGDPGEGQPGVGSQSVTHQGCEMLPADPCLLLQVLPALGGGALSCVPGPIMWEHRPFI